MLYADFKDFVANLPPTGRLLGIDWGRKRMGIAISTPDRNFVFAHSVIRDQESGTSIKELIESERIVGIIIGLPTYADGTDSATTACVREFAKQVSVAVSVPVGFIDESLTSVEAEEITQNSKLKTQNLDPHAAAVILENAIAMINRSVPNP